MPQSSESEGGAGPLPVEMQGPEVLQVYEGMRCDEGDGVPGQRQVNQPGHVCKVFPLHTTYTPHQGIERDINNTCLSVFLAIVKVTMLIGQYSS